MRLLMISSEFPPGPGGIGNHAHQLALNLHRLGWDVVVQTPQDYATKEERASFDSALPFKLARVDSGRGRMREAWHRFRVGWGLVQSHRPDVLVGTGLSGVWVAAALSAARGQRMAAVAHGSEFGTTGACSGAVNRLAFETAAVVVAVSHFTKSVVARAGIRPRRVEVIPNAAELGGLGALPERQRRRFRQDAGFNGAPLLLTVGHVSERKGQETVIRALPRILKKAPGTQYLMVGLPTLKPELSRLAQDLGVSQHVHFLGKVSDQEKVRWLNCCDLFLMTSRTTEAGDCEGFGIAVVEAAMCGKPAVVSSGSGVLEAIEDGVTGLAVPEADPNATAEAVVSLLTDPPRRAAMGAAAQTRALREQTWETCARKYDALLREIAPER